MTVSKSKGVRVECRMSLEIVAIPKAILSRNRAFRDGDSPSFSLCEALLFVFISGGGPC